MLMHKVLRNILPIIFVGIIFIIVPTNAEEPIRQIELSLQDCISLALRSNLNIRIQSINPQIQDSLLLMAKGKYDPSLRFNTGASLSENTVNDQKSTAQNLNFAIIDPLITGGEYGISINSNRSKSESSFQSMSPSYRSGTVFSISQPLLEGAGIAINRIPIVIANNNKQISNLRLKSQLIKNLTEVQNTYWELVFALENLKVQELALKQAQDLLNLNIKLKENDKASISDILQAQSAVASREADVLSARDAIKDAEDKLKRITNIIQDESQWDVSIIPIDVPPFEEITIDAGDSIALALEKRPEYLQAKLDVENSDLTIKLAKNQKLPIIDLDGSLSLNGLGDTFGETFSQVGKAENRSWTAGIALRMPLGGRSDNGYLKKSQLEKEQKLLTLKEQEQQVIADVRSAVRQIETGIKRIQATTKAEEFARQVLTTEEKKYSLGLSTSFNLLQFQANLATATKNRLRAVIDYHKSIANLYQSQGITLEKLNIAFEE